MGGTAIGIAPSSGSLQDAAVKHDAFSVAQIVTQLKPWTRMMEIMDEKTGKGTGKFKVDGGLPGRGPRPTSSRS